MKKKLLSLALALALSLSLAVPAFAAEEDKTGTTAPTESSGEEKKDETPAEGEEKKDEAPAEDGEKKDETPAEDGEKKDEAPAEDGEKKDEAPAEDGEKKDEAAPKFTDVAADSPFAAAIDWAVAGGITLGTTETTFGPGNTCSISNILTFLWRANGKPGAAEGVSDRDSAAKWAVEQKLIAEDQDVSAPCTRVMAVGFMWGVAGKPEVEAELSFTDVDKDADYAGAVAWAVDQKITSGTSETTFSPDNTCTRGQIVTFLFRAANAAAPAEKDEPAEKAESAESAESAE